MQVLEACLESHGVNVKDLHPPPVDMSTELCYSIPASRSPMRVDSQMQRNSGEWKRANSIRAFLCDALASAISPELYLKCGQQRHYIGMLA